jgi:SAM-dependent methyltransferase
MQDAPLQDTREILAAHLPKRKLRVYGAGGGSTSWLPPDVLARSDIVVVDIDKRQLENNRYAQQKILGNIESCTFPPASFDLIACFNVIEHLESPPAAIERFSEALRPGGLLLIGAPNPRSLSGMVTRFTPHAFHVWYYRAVLKKPDAGHPGQPPFPVVYHPIVAPDALLSYCRKLGLDAVYREDCRSGRDETAMRSRPWLAAALRATTATMNLIFLGTRNFDHSDYRVIFQKPLNSRFAPLGQSNPSRSCHATTPRIVSAT